MTGPLANDHLPAMDVATRHGRRNRRLGASEVRKRVMDKASELLLADGLTVSLEHINLEVVIRYAGVSRSSVYRLWETKDDFVVDFLKEIAKPSWLNATTFDDVTIKAAAEVIKRGLDLLATADGRQQLLEDVVQAVVPQAFDFITGSPAWRTLVAMASTVMSLPVDVRGDITEALKEAQAAYIERMSGFYLMLAELLGRRFKPEFEPQHLAAAGGALVKGLMFRDLMSQQLPLTSDGRQWSLVAKSFLALVDMMTELNPSYQAPESLEPEHVDHVVNRLIEG